MLLARNAVGYGAYFRSHGLRALSCFLMHAMIIGSRLRGLWARVLL